MTTPSPDHRPTVLLLDIMSTVVYDPFAEEMPDFFDMTFDELLDAKRPGAWFRFERGEIDEHELAEQFFEDGRPVDLEGLKSCFYEHYRFVDDMEALLEDLHDRDVEMHAMSNYGPWYRMIEDKLELSRFLEWSFVSCRTGVRKPDEEAYLNAVETLGVEPSDCFFVDDREGNVEAAREAGLRAAKFEDAASLREELGKRLEVALA